MARRIYIVLAVDDPESLALSQWQRDSDSDGAHGPSAHHTPPSLSLSGRVGHARRRGVWSVQALLLPLCSRLAVRDHPSVGRSESPARRGDPFAHSVAGTLRLAASGRCAHREEPPRSALWERGPPVPTRRGSLAGTRVTVFSSTGSRRKSAPPQGLCARMCQPDVCQWFRSHLNLSLKTFEVVQV